jgi:enolase-phosphatase E1
MTIRVILVDIEGTTTSISFVFDVLFPYARQHIAEYVRDNVEDPAVQRELEAVNQEVGQQLTAEQAIEQLIRWIDQDRKATPLKALQGMIWQQGYVDKAYTGHIYPDAVKRLRQWWDDGIKLYVYSSGSVQAQKLLFGHSDFGDLTQLFSGYFDTRIGMKRNSGSYQRISDETGVDAEDFLFLSDSMEELDAARAAGMQTIRLVRDRQDDNESGHPICHDFSEINVTDK